MGSLQRALLEYVDDTVVRFGNKVDFENWK